MYCSSLFRDQSRTKLINLCTTQNSSGRTPEITHKGWKQCIYEFYSKFYEYYWIENKARLQLPNNYNKENKDEEIGLKATTHWLRKLQLHWLFFLLIFICFMYYSILLNLFKKWHVKNIRLYQKYFHILQISIPKFIPCTHLKNITKVYYY